MSQTKKFYRMQEMLMNFVDLFYKSSIREYFLRRRWASGFE